MFRSRGKTFLEVRVIWHVKPRVCKIIKSYYLLVNRNFSSFFPLSFFLFYICFGKQSLCHCFSEGFFFPWCPCLFGSVCACLPISPSTQRNAGLQSGWNCILEMRYYFYTNSVSKQEFTYQEVGTFNFPHGEPALCSDYNPSLLSVEQKDISEALAPSEGALRNGARTNRVLFCSAKGRASAVRGESIFFLSCLLLDFLLAGRGGGGAEQQKVSIRRSFLCLLWKHKAPQAPEQVSQLSWRCSRDIACAFSSDVMGKSCNRISSSRKSTKRKHLMSAGPNSDVPQSR